MNHKLSASVRSICALGLLLSGASAFAQSYVSTPVAGTGLALSQNGSVAGYTGGGSEPWLSGPEEFYVTGPNGVGSTDLGGSSAGNYGTYNSSGVFSFGDGSLDGIQSGSAASVTPSPSFYLYNPSIATIVGVNNAGAIAANANTYSGAHGLVINADGSETGVGGLVTGINASGAVTFNSSTYSTPSNNLTVQSVNSLSAAVLATPGGQQWLNYEATIGYPPGAAPGLYGVFNTLTVSPSYVLAAGSTTPTAVADLGYGSVANGLNATGQVTGSVYAGPSALTTPYLAFLVNGVLEGGISYPSPITLNTGEAFRTGANASGVTVLDMAGGVSSTGLAINDAGQVGGYLTLADGQDEAFLSAATGTYVVGIGAGASTDSDKLIYLNNSGQAIIDDLSTDTYYLYSGGVLVPVTDLGATADDAVVGLSDSGQILMADPEILSPVTPGTDIGSISGAYVNSGTGVYASVAGSEGYAPSASFNTDPTGSSNADFTPFAGSSGGSSVPAPGGFGLLGVALAAVFTLRRRKTVRA